MEEAEVERTEQVMKRARMTPQAQQQPQAAAGDDDETDRLSALDDATLHLILARLPFRDAAATSVLSRRWPRVFATLPRLRLQPATFNRRGFDDGGDEDYCEDPDRWMDALDCVLDSRAAPVAAFDVSFKYMGQYDDWFRDLFRELCGSGGLLQELTVSNTKFREPYPLPSPVYNCQTLTSLELFHVRLKVPARLAGLRAVRSLRLHCVVASDADLRRVVSRCTAMERLEMFSVHKARNLVVRAPRLENLKVDSHRPLCIKVKSAPRLDTVSLGLSYGWAEFSWSTADSMDSDEDYTLSEIENMCDYEKMAEREHHHTDEVANMLTFLGGLGCVKKLKMCLPTEYAKVLSLSIANNVSMPKRLTKKSYLLGLETLALTLDHNHEVLATLLSCLLNSSPNLKDLRIKESCLEARHVPLAAEFWEQHLSADCVVNRLSSFTFFTETPFEGHPCGGLCRFMVMNARVLKRMRIEYLRSMVKPEHAAKLEAVRNELNLLPRASPDLLVELVPLDCYPSY